MQEYTHSARGQASRKELEQADAGSATTISLSNLPLINNIMLASASRPEEAPPRSFATEVLSSRELWDAIASWTTGYPLALIQLLHDRDLNAKLLQVQSMTTAATLHFVGDLFRRGILPHLTIIANDASMIRELFRLSKHPQYARNHRQLPEGDAVRRAAQQC